MILNTPPPGRWQVWDTPYSREYHTYIQCSNVIHEESVLKGLVGILAVMAQTQDVTHHTQDSMQFKDCSIVWRCIITHTKCEIWTARCFYWDVYEFNPSPCIGSRESAVWTLMQYCITYLCVQILLTVCTALPLWMQYALAIYHIVFGETYKIMQEFICIQ